MKRLILTLFLGLLSFLGMYAANRDTLAQKELSKEEFSNTLSRIAVIQGSFSDYYVTDSMRNARLLRFEKIADVVVAMINGKADYFITTEALANEIIRKDNCFRIVMNKFLNEPHNAAFRKTDQGRILCEKFNRFIAKIKADGIHTEMYNRWFCNPSLAEMPQLNLPTQGEAIICGTVSDMFPFEFIQDGKLSGFDIELINRFSIELGVPIKIKKYNFGGLIAALESQKIDLICTNMDFTPERGQLFLFSNMYVGSSSVVMERREEPATANSDSNLWKDIKEVSTPTS